jgi:hypothetical protein
MTRAKWDELVRYVSHFEPNCIDKKISGRHDGPTILWADRVVKAAEKVSSLLQPGGGRLGLVDAHNQLRAALRILKEVK